MSEGPRCLRCNLNLTRMWQPDGPDVWVCVCCDGRFQRGNLSDCHHNKEEPK